MLAVNDDAVTVTRGAACLGRHVCSGERPLPPAARAVASISGGTIAALVQLRLQTA